MTEYRRAHVVSEVRCLRGCNRTWPRDPALEVACTTCGAGVGVRCKRPSEWRVWGGGVHPDRDRAADGAGHYGRCPLGICGLKEQLQLDL